MILAVPKIKLEDGTYKYVAVATLESLVYDDNDACLTDKLALISQGNESKKQIEAEAVALKAKLDAVEVICS